MSSKITRTSTPAIAITREQADAALAKYRQAKLDETALCTRMKIILDRIEARYQTKLKTIQASGTEAFKIVQAYAAANPGEFVKTRSITTPVGSFGFRLNPFAVKPLKGNSLKPTLLFLLKRRVFRELYVRLTPDVDKEALIRDRDKLKAKTLVKMGIRIAQEDTFFVDANLKPVQPVTTEVA